MDTDPLGKAPWDAIAARVRAVGALSPEALVRAAGINGPKRKAAERVLSLSYDGPTLVGLPSGKVSHLLHVFDGCWLTQRVRAATDGRNDLWATSALAPIVTALIEAPIPHCRGDGVVAMSEHLLPAIVGPPGWLPDVPAGGLVGLRIRNGELEARGVDAPDTPLPTQQGVRALVGRHYLNERWYVEDDNATRITLTRALASAVMEDPELLRSPIEPLDELLADPLREQHQHIFRDMAACHQLESISFSLHAMPVALEMELRRRAELFGMSVDQYVIAILGHLAWRTPFAEDMEPWDGWVASDSQAAVMPLRPTGGDGKP